MFTMRQVLIISFLLATLIGVTIASENRTAMIVIGGGNKSFDWWAVFNLPKVDDVIGTWEGAGASIMILRRQLEKLGISASALARDTDHEKMRFEISHDEATNPVVVLRKALTGLGQGQLALQSEMPLEQLHDYRKPSFLEHPEVVSLVPASEIQRTRILDLTELAVKRILQESAKPIVATRQQKNMSELEVEKVWKELLLPIRADELVIDYKLGVIAFSYPTECEAMLIDLMRDISTDLEWVHPHQ